MRRTYFIVTTNQTPRNRRQICLHAQFCAIKLVKTPKLFKVNVHENIHWLNQQDLMVTQIGPGGPTYSEANMQTEIKC